MSTPFTDEEKGFIRELLDHPEELTIWLVYADWLDDRGDPRSEFLRLTVERRQIDPADPRAAEIEARLAVLGEILDPRWMLVFDTAPVVNCPMNLGGPCPSKTWVGLLPTDEPDIRICHTCNKPVFYCHTVEEAREFASCGQVVTLPARIPPSEYPQPPPPEEPLDEDVEEIEGTLDELFPPPRRSWWKFW